MITLSSKAGEVVRAMVQQEKLPEGTALRVGVSREGCDGSGTEFRYTMGFESNVAAPNDEVFESEGVRIYVDRESLPHLDGLQLDAQEQFGGAKFLFRNPKAQHSCGCGHTFSDEEPKE